jgi:hypothetical protein
MRRTPGTPGGRFWLGLAIWLDAAARTWNEGTAQREALEVACAWLGETYPPDG